MKESSGKSKLTLSLKIIKHTSSYSVIINPDWLYISALYVNMIFLMESQKLSYQIKFVCIFVLLQIRNKILGFTTQLRKTPST